MSEMNSEMAKEGCDMEAMEDGWMIMSERALGKEINGIIGRLYGVNYEIAQRAKMRYK